MFAKKPYADYNLLIKFESFVDYIFGKNVRVQYGRERQMRFGKIMKVLAAIVLLIMPVSQAYAYAGVVTVGNVQVEPGDKGELEIRLSNNDSPISGIEIPMHKTMGDITIDSISFEGNMASSAFYGSVSPFGPIGDTFDVFILPSGFPSPFPTISATNGLLATIHFTVSPTAFDGIIYIDSLFTVDSLPLGGGGYTVVIKQVNASDPTGLITYFPDFVSGSITIGTPTDVNDDNFNKGLPTSFALGQNYPNPFNPSTIIEFALPEASQVRLEIYNILGQSVDVLVDERLSAGIHQVTFEASSNPSGVYFYRLTHNDGVETKKMTLLK